VSSKRGEEGILLWRKRTECWRIASDLNPFKVSPFYLLHFKGASGLFEAALAASVASVACAVGHPPAGEILAKPLAAKRVP
jgi:hypothetical protein